MIKFFRFSTVTNIQPNQETVTNSFTESVGGKDR